MWWDGSGGGGTHKGRMMMASIIGMMIVSGQVYRTLELLFLFLFTKSRHPRIERRFPPLFLLYVSFFFALKERSTRMTMR